MVVQALCDEKAERFFYHSILKVCDSGESSGPSKRTNSHLSKTLFQFQARYTEAFYSEFVTSKHLFLILNFPVLFRRSSVSDPEGFVSQPSQRLPSSAVEWLSWKSSYQTGLGFDFGFILYIPVCLFVFYVDKLFLKNRNIV